MTPTARSIRQKAREAMGQSTSPFWLVTLIYLLLCSILPNVVEEFIPTVDPAMAGVMMGTGALSSAFSYLISGGTLSLFVSLVSLMFTTIISYGFALWSLRCWRGEECESGSLFEGFGAVPRILIGYIVSAIMQILLVIVYVLGLAIAFSALFLVVSSTPLMIVISIVYLAVAAIAVCSVIMRYSLVPFLLADHPEMPPSRAAFISAAMMRGNIKRLFRLYLSFIGWFILTELIATTASCIGAMLTGVNLSLLLTMDYDAFYHYLDMFSQTVPYWLGLLATIPIALWLTPYIQVSLAGFYQSLIPQPQNPAPPSDYAQY